MVTVVTVVLWSHTLQQLDGWQPPELNSHHFQHVVSAVVSSLTEQEREAGWRLRLEIIVD